MFSQEGNFKLALRELLIVYRIWIGHDFSSRIMGRSYGNYGCTRFFDFAVPLLKQLGYESAIEKITVTNPMNILSY